MFVSTDEKKLHAAAFVGDKEEMKGICGCRIPALLNVKLEAEKYVLVAAADVGNEGADWGNLGLAMRRSWNRGETWDKPRQIFRIQAHHAPQGFHDWQSPFTIDPVLIQAQDGSLLAVVDLWPESKGFGHHEWLEDTTGYQEINGKQYPVLLAEPSSVGEEKKEGEGVPLDSAQFYTIREEGWVYDPAGNPTRYYVPQHHDPATAFHTYGDMYYAREGGRGEYVQAYPPLIPTSSQGTGDTYVGNVWMSFQKPAFSPEQPVFVAKRRVGPGGTEAGYDGPSDYEILETDPAPLRRPITMLLLCMRSTDGGETWGQPYEISGGFKRPADGPFLGVGPGVGLRLEHQPKPEHNGRLLLPLYNATDVDLRAGVAYSDDNGFTWHRGGGEQGFVRNRDEIQFVELPDGKILSFGRRGGGWAEGPGPTPVSSSADGGITWKVEPDTAIHGVRCQKSFLAYPQGLPYFEGMTPGKQYILATYPASLTRYEGCTRTDGAVSLGEVQPDGTIRWIAKRLLALPTQYQEADAPQWKHFFAYSCLSVLEDGTVGLLYEPQPNNYIAFCRFTLPWLLEKAGQVIEKE